MGRIGGNRWTAYNWETNASNAGSDYLYQNDTYLGGGSAPGGAVAGPVGALHARASARCHRAHRGLGVGGHHGAHGSSGGADRGTRFFEVASGGTLGGAHRTRAIGSSTPTSSWTGCGAR
jgi:hypothetical protein